MKKLYALLFFCSLFISSAVLAQTIRYVKAGASGNGSSWATASGDLQAMINAAATNDEIWVAAGTYFPSELLNTTLKDGSATTARDRAFIMRTGVKIYGGFVGTESLLTARNYTTNVTILSGDLGTIGDRSDNAYHIVASKNASIGAVLDGFTLQDGYANGTGIVFNSGTLEIPQNSGAAIASRGAATNIDYKNLIIKNNEATGIGGAVYIYISFTSTSGTGIFNFSNIQFLNNKGGGTGEGGGAMYVNRTSGATTINIVDSKFTGNTSANSAGAIYYGTATTSILNITNTTFDNNTANAGNGGAIYFTTGTLKLNNVAFTANKSLASTGAVYLGTTSAVSTLTDVTFTNNTASTTAGAMYLLSNSPAVNNVKFIGNKAGTNGGAVFTFGTAPAVTSPVFTNCLFYNNEAASAASGGGAIYNSTSTSSSLINSTLYSNKATAGNGGAILNGSTSATLNVFNTIIYGNTALLAGADIHNAGPGTVSVKNSLTQSFGVTGADGNIVGSDPVFKSVDFNNSTDFLRLDEESPSINAGEANLFPGLTTATKDIVGKNRVIYTLIDMGAYEYDGPAPVAPLIVDINENLPIGSFVAQPVTSLTGTITNWAIESGNLDNVFTINPATGALSVSNSSVLDYETRTTLTIKVRVTNNLGQNQGLRILVRINNLLEDPGAPVIANVVNDVLTSFKPKFTGMAEPSSTITLYIDGKPYPTTVGSDAQGRWKLDFIEEIPAGIHTFYVISSNSTLGTSNPGPSIQVTFKLYSGSITPNNILTPNGDGKNDVWKVENLTSMYPKNEVIVYDKVGKVVYRQKNYQSDWDGTYQGQVLATGSYYYDINIGASLDRIKGMITIIKGK